MLPGFSRTQCAPASIAFSASVWLKWMSAITGIGDCATIALQRLGVLLAGHRHAHDVRAGLGDRADLVHRRRQVRGLGLGHRLHRHRRAATDRDRADVDLALGGHRLILRCPTSTPPPVGRSRAWPRPWPPRARARRHARFFALTRLPAGARVLDVGCGALGLRALEPELDVTGVDLVERPDYPGPFVRADAADGPAVRRRTSSTSCTARA